MAAATHPPPPTTEAKDDDDGKAPPPSNTEAKDDDAGKAPPPSPSCFSSSPSQKQQQRQTTAASPYPSSSPEDLVARAIAPVKPQYLLPPTHLRPSNNNNNNKQPPGQEVVGEEQSNQVASDGKGGEAGGGNGVGVVREKKSKRQLKRERQQEKKSVRNLCPEIARRGNVDACKYGSGCCFSHDLDGFLKQKPGDLPGTCPLENAGDTCPYGVACRFLGTHGRLPASASEKDFCENRSSSEVNSLSKDLQKLLWKDKVEYPKANAQLKLLGLPGGKNLPKTKSTQLSDGKSSSPIVCSEEDSLDDADARLQKKAKQAFDQECASATPDGEVHFETKNEEIMSTRFHKASSPNGKQVSPRVEVIPTMDLREKKLIDFRGKLYLAPLTTVGNLPFRRVCKSLGADITCGEMAMCTNLLQGQASEWALLRRHSSEDLFGVQICGAYPDTVSRTVELIGRECSVDFIDINMGCPIDVVVNKGAGSALLTKPMRMKNIIQIASATTDKPLTVKVRTGFLEGRNRIDFLLGDISNSGANAVTIHGRSRQQRYSKVADWDYIYKCAKQAPDSLQILGNGDIFSYLDWNKHSSDCSQLSSCLIARGALIKPWIFTEIKEQRHWDITSGERLEILKKYVNFGLEHWGSDNKGVETTRHFLLEWLSYTCRYVPVGLLDVIPQRLNWRPPSYFGRDSLETLMASDSAADWVKISEMLLGKVPDGFSFAPKHKSNAYDRAENG